jgi:hypothetical protein
MDDDATVLAKLVDCDITSVMYLTPCSRPRLTITPKPAVVFWTISPAPSLALDSHPHRPVCRSTIASVPTGIRRRNAIRADAAPSTPNSFMYSYFEASIACTASRAALRQGVQARSKRVSGLSPLMRVSVRFRCAAARSFATSSLVALCCFSFPIFAKFSKLIWVSDDRNFR